MFKRKILLSLGIGLIGILGFTGCGYTNPDIPSIPKQKYSMANDPLYQEISNYVDYSLQQDKEFYYKKNFIQRKIASNEDDLGIYTINTQKFSTYKKEHISVDLLDKVKFDIPSIVKIAPKDKSGVYLKHFKLNILNGKIIKEFNLKTNDYYLLTVEDGKLSIYNKLDKKECQTNPYQTLCYTDQLKNKTYFYIKFQHNHLIIQNKLISKIVKPGDVVNIYINNNKKYKLLVPKP